MNSYSLHYRGLNSNGFMLVVLIVTPKIALKPCIRVGIGYQKQTHDIDFHFKRLPLCVGSCK